MCGRYWIDPEDETDEVLRVVARMNRADLHTSGEIRPGDLAAVVAPSRKGGFRPFAMQWGWHLPTGLLINIRCETAPEKSVFRDSYLHRRCTLPMNSYFEWEHRGRDQIRYRIFPENGRCRLAALYRYEGNVPYFAVLTQPPAPEIEFIHDRMPVLIPVEMEEAWLAGGEMPPHPPDMDYLCM